jgi:serine/threonine protein kinase
MTASEIAGRYEIIRPIGTGSFGRTLLARERGSGREVAVKVLHPRAAENWKAFELFEREASVMRQLRHPGVPAVIETFRAPWDGAEAAFLVMEYVEGESIAQWIAARRHLAPDALLQLFVDVLGVLDYLHTRVPPILHRDIKPANLIVRPDGSPALVDFGAVRNVFRDPDDGGSTVVGTYGYMPYEQLMGLASPASDLYALGATFLHLVTGRAPPEFMGSAGGIEVPESLPGGEPLRGVLARMLAPSPAMRFQSAREARGALLGGGRAAVIVTAPPIPPFPILAITPLDLGPPPRRLEGELAALWRRLSYSPGQLMDPTSKPDTGWNAGDVFLVSLFSVLTVGVLPAVFWSIYRSRRKRFRDFLINGQYTIGRVIDQELEEIAFEKSLSRVRYQFEAHGALHTDTDLVLPSIARRWAPGGPVHVLYLTDRDYDSVIISVS